MTRTSARRRDGRVLPRILILLVLVGAFGLWVMKATAPPRACSPDAPRPWAAEAFEARTAARSPAPWPTSGSRPGAAVVSPAGDRVRTDMPAADPDAPEPWERFERVPVAAGNVARLPGAGGTWTAELTAWRAPGSPWLDPARGEPMDFSIESGGSSTYVDGELEFVVEVKRDGSGGAPLNGRVRMNGGALFDRNTGFKFAGSSGSSAIDGQLRYTTWTALAHRADLMLEVLLSYGEPVVAEVDAVSDNQVHIEASTVFRVEHVGPGHGGGVGLVGNGRRILDLRDVTPGAPASVAVISAWPFPMADRILVQSHDGGRWTGPIAANGLSTVEWYRVPPPDTLRVHLLPHTARVQFELPPPMTLPEVDDLFDLPAPLATDPWMFQGALASRLQIQMDGEVIPSSGPPAAASAGEALFKALGGRSQRYDPREFTVKSDTLALLGRITHWLRRLVP